MPRQRSEQPPQQRLLAAGKALFAQVGYEQTSTSAITRRAGTSESQLMRYFDGKRGLLAAIFDGSWHALNSQIEEIVNEDVTEAVPAIELVLSTVIVAFERDRELANLFLLEGRRIHAGERDLVLSRGYLEFVDFLQRLIRRAQKARTIAPRIDGAALSSALIGAAEGMIRDRLIAERAGQRQPFSQQQIRHVFSAFLQGIRERKRTVGVNRKTRATRGRSPSR